MRRPVNVSCLLRLIDARLGQGSVPAAVDTLTEYNVFHSGVQYGDSLQPQGSLHVGLNRTR
jgi:triacylglycerol esterase/lipase EstA (alpha/beta hydrolase family)